MKNEKLLDAIIFLLIPLIVGQISSLFSSNSVELYSSLMLPQVAPPSYVFPIVWTLLYILMGVSSYIIFSSGNPISGKALRFYWIQLFFNFTWSFIFFNLQNYTLAFIWILCLLIFIVIMIIRFYKISPLAAILQIPYLLWILFATYLNFYIMILN